VLILDEAHSFKNRSSDRSRTGIKALERAEKVLYATATPIDKIDHLDYLGRLGVFGDRTGRQFRRFANSKDPDAIGLHSTISERFDSLTKDGVMVRRELTLKGVDVGFTSVKIPKQAKDDMEKTASTYSNNADRAQKLMTQRRQLEPYKIPAATREVNLALKEGRQAIVFVSRVNDSSTPSGVSTATAGALRKQLALAGITDVAELHGSADIDRTEAAKRFQSSKAKVLITTLESGGTGINLDDVVGDKPRTIVMMTPPFSAVENVQAIGRVWRYNTKSMPQVKYLFSDTAVDQWNQTIIETKMRSLEANVKGEINALKIPTPRTDSANPNVMNSFSLNSLLVFRKDELRPSRSLSLLNIFLNAREDKQSIPGKPCGDSFIPASFRCHQHYTATGKLNDSGRIQLAKYANQIRKMKGLPANERQFTDKTAKAQKANRSILRAIAPKVVDGVTLPVGVDMIAGSGGRYREYKYTTDSGQQLDFTVEKYGSGYEVNFTINESLGRERVAKSPEEKRDNRALAIKVLSIFKAEIRSRTDGTTYVTTPATGDGLGGERRKLYGKAGFKSSFVSNEMNGYVENGKLKPGILRDRKEPKKEQSIDPREMEDFMALFEGI
jgi:superfamily II DNA/RNA helicase